MFPDIVSKIDDLKRSKITKKPCHTNRASAIGDDCERRLYYMRTAWEKAEDTPLDLQYIFEEGHKQEVEIIKDMQEAGFVIIEQQRSFAWSEHQISGSIDGMLSWEGESIPFDAKSMSPHVWEKVSDVDSLKRFPWTKKYTAQIVIYMLMSNSPKGILIFKNKTSGKFKQMNFLLDDFLDIAEELIQKADRINSAVKSGIVPEKLEDINECRRCPFRLHCLPDQNLDALDIVDDEELAAMLDKKENLEAQINEIRDIIDEYEEVKDQIKYAVSGKNVICGSWHITGKWATRKAYQAKESTYWLPKITKIE